MNYLTMKAKHERTTAANKTWQKLGGGKINQQKIFYQQWFGLYKQH